MFSITVLAVGRLKEPYYTAAAAEYARRLGAYSRVRLVELPECRLPENPAPAEIAAALEKEGARILAKVPKGAWLCVLTPEGETLSSEGFARRLASVKQRSGEGCFVLGSSYGLSPQVKVAADARLSMSAMTFPHHLARVMLLEQLYRAESIQVGGKYHK